MLPRGTHRRGSRRRRPLPQTHRYRHPRPIRISGSTGMLELLQHRRPPPRSASAAHESSRPSPMRAGLRVPCARIPALRRAVRAEQNGRAIHAPAFNRLGPQGRYGPFSLDASHEPRLSSLHIVDGLCLNKAATIRNTQRPANPNPSTHNHSPTDTCA